MSTESSPPQSDYLQRVRQLIELAIRRRWSEGLITRDPDGVFTAFLGSDHVEKLLHPAGSETVPALATDFTYHQHTPLGRLIQEYGIGPSEGDLLALLLALEIDPAVARLVSYLGGNQSQFSLTLDLVFEIVYRTRAAQQDMAAALMHHDLAAHHRLRRLRYLILDGADNRVALAQGIRMAPRLVSWLLGRRELDPELTALANLFSAEAPVGECDPESLDTAMAAFQRGGRLLLLVGPPQSGREMLLRFAAAKLGRPLLVAQARGIGPDRMVAAFREASLQHALLAFYDGDEAIEGETGHRFRDALAAFPETVAVIGSGRSAPTLGQLRPMTTIKIAVPLHRERVRLWQTFLGPDTALSEDELHQTASLYNLGIGGIVAATTRAVEMATFAHKRVDRSHVAQAVRQLFDADLSAVATRMEVTQDWSDLVLPDDIGESMAEIIQRIRFRSQVLGGWGFARKLGKGLGLTVLFSGEPGTGKSMAAGLIANELGLDLYTIDLARVTSKWLGETEKNLARAFDAAEAGHVMLLFDEADSLLAKRSGNIQSSNDRHANLETNFILARLEQFTGIAFFTTNLPSAIDPAIARRMSLHINFPFPDVEARTLMWQRLIPKEAPADEAIDFQGLAERYELSGGFIRNIVLRAAYRAIRDGDVIRTEHLQRAAEVEYRERGLLVAGGRLT